MKINLEQKKSLSSYFGNLSIAWFATGIIGPIVTKQNIYEFGSTITMSLLFSVALFVSMLKFITVKKQKRK
ncbi:hypothetical protein COS53_01735 [Candidatus Shapirobacteria bacterium CG03_land_8_20_14_0_80_35_14]|uniref:Uncharacterized protein n=1 Tax=Candidatus Shapirobacteria bacterium CG03_land_8_20_14_0_80_35_14 TaxID=1974878 RepID=A0A2M7BQ24_9BACT|nr:MAG: hypothetical protein COS53_01735 [Candidatus Shapirobacteria bacterium CG03_land_8_20_14_0_80_35_14]